MWMQGNSFLGRIGDSKKKSVYMGDSREIMRKRCHEAFLWLKFIL